MQGGATLQHHTDSGSFKLEDKTALKTINPSTVQALIEAGIITKCLSGHCTLTELEAT